MENQRNYIVLRNSLTFASFYAISFAKHQINDHVYISYIDHTIIIHINHFVCCIFTQHYINVIIYIANINQAITICIAKRFWF